VEDLIWALANRTRRRILALLARGPTYLLEMSRVLSDVSQPALLKHLREMERRGIIESFTAPGAPGAPPRKYYRLASQFSLSLFVGEGGIIISRGTPSLGGRISERTLGLLSGGVDELLNLAAIGDKDMVREAISDVDKALEELEEARCHLLWLRSVLLRMLEEGSQRGVGRE